MGKRQKKRGKGKFDLPKELFVYWYDDGGGGYYAAHVSAADVKGTVSEDGPTPVGIYKLTEVGEVSTETTYKRKRFTKGG